MCEKKTSIFRGLIWKNFDVCETVFDVLCFNKTGLLKVLAGFHFAGNVMINAIFSDSGFIGKKVS